MALTISLPPWSTTLVLILLLPVTAGLFPRQTSNIPPPTPTLLTAGFSTTGYPTTPPAGCSNPRCVSCVSSHQDYCTGSNKDPIAELQCICLAWDFCADQIDVQASFSDFVTWRNKQCPTEYYPTSSPSFNSPLKGAFPTCADDCVSSMFSSNIWAYNCFFYRPGLSVDCSCMHFPSCSTACKSSSDASSFSLWKQSYCTSFKSIYPTNAVGPDATRMPSTSTPTPTPSTVQSIFGGPTCFDSISTVCPELQSALEWCIDGTTPTECFCRELAKSSCTKICQVGEETADYLRWALGWCENYNIITNTMDGIANFSSYWEDYPSYQRTAYLNFFPWTWRVQYDPEFDHRPLGNGSQPIPTCPSERSKIGSFALINLIVLLVTVILGRRPVLNYITCRLCGRPEGSALWPLVALLLVGLQIAANFANAVIVRASPGFGNISAADLVLLWCSRPRIAWIAACLVSVGKEYGFYFSISTSALVAEFVLQFMGAVYLGRTVNFAVARHFYTDRIKGVVVGANNALLMYSGALLWIVGIGAVLFQIAYSFLGIRTLLVRLWESRPKQSTPETRIENRTCIRASISTKLRAWVARSQKSMITNIQLLKLGIAEANSKSFKFNVLSLHTTPVINWIAMLDKMGLGEEALKRITFVAAWMVPPFIGQWLFWAGFVKLADELYCPPKLGYLTAVWSVSGVIGVFIGGTL